MAGRRPTGAAGYLLAFDQRSGDGWGAATPGALCKQAGQRLDRLVLALDLLPSLRFCSSPFSSIEIISLAQSRGEIKHFNLTSPPVHSLLGSI